MIKSSEPKVHVAQNVNSENLRRHNSLAHRVATPSATRLVCERIHLFLYKLLESMVP